MELGVSSSMAEEEYDTDPEESKPSLGMRRRQASDDEEGAGGDTDGEKSLLSTPIRNDSRVGVGSDEESEGQGGVANYNDDDAEGEEDFVERGDDDEGFEERVGADIGEVEEGDYGEAVDVEAETLKGLEGEISRLLGVRMQEGDGAEEGLEEEEEEVEKKENEPFAVPTAGAFYMHDDRFRDISRGRHRCGHAVWILYGSIWF